MINFNSSDASIRISLDGNLEYIDFVRHGCTKGYIFIEVQNVHVVLFHDINDIFSSFLLPDELYYYRNNIDDIRRITNTIQNFATLDYKRNCNP